MSLLYQGFRYIEVHYIELPLYVTCMISSLAGISINDVAIFRSRMWFYCLHPVERWVPLGSSAAVWDKELDHTLSHDTRLQKAHKSKELWMYKGWFSMVNTSFQKAGINIWIRPQWINPGVLWQGEKKEPYWSHYQIHLCQSAFCIDFSDLEMQIPEIWL